MLKTEDLADLSYLLVVRPDLRSVWLSPLDLHIFYRNSGSIREKAPCANPFQDFAYLWLRTFHGPKQVRCLSLKIMVQKHTPLLSGMNSYGQGCAYKEGKDLRPIIQFPYVQYGVDKMTSLIDLF